MGTARGALAKSIKRLITELGVHPHRMIAAIGPTLGPEHFIPTLEVDKFTLADERDRRHDLAAAMRRHGLFVALPAHLF